MKEGEIKIFYKAPEINEELDMMFEALLEDLGYKRWASGYNLVDKVRDLAFERREL